MKSGVSAHCLSVSECYGDFTTTTRDNARPRLWSPAETPGDELRPQKVRKLGRTGAVCVDDPKIVPNSSVLQWRFNVIGMKEGDLGAVRGPYRGRSCPLLMHVHKRPCAASVGVHFPDISSLDGNS